MDVGSPENGFDAISDLLKDDESSMPPDLDLFLLNRDYVFDDFGSVSKLNLGFCEQAQPQLPALMSDSGHPLGNFQSSARTDGNSGGDVLPDTNADFLCNNEELLREFRSLSGTRQNEDAAQRFCAAGYLCDSGSQAHSAACIGDAPMDVFRHPNLVPHLQDAIFEVEMADLRDSSHNNNVMDEETYELEDADVTGHQIEQLEYDCTNLSALRNSMDGIIDKELDALAVFQHQGTSICGFQVPQYHNFSSSDGRQDGSHPNISHDLEFCRADGVDPTLDHSFHISVEDSVSTLASWQRFQHYPQGHPAENVDTADLDSPMVKIYGSNSEQARHELYGMAGYGGGEVTPMENPTQAGGLQDSTSPMELGRQLKTSSSSRCSPAPTTRARSSHRRSHRRVERSDSPSPVRRRNHHGGNRRERYRSRSRSPRARDHHRRTRRQESPGCSHSSRRRSPGRAHSRTRSRARPGNCLFVAGFSFSTSERDLERKFSRFGWVRNVRIIRDRRSGISRGYGFVTLKRDEEANAAMRALHESDWNGRIILVEKSFKVLIR